MDRKQIKKIKKKQHRNKELNHVMIFKCNQIILKISVDIKTTL
jgi:hypothetical protein